MPILASLALATFLVLVPVTLLVPGLHELVVIAHGGSASDAHAFMALNMLAGMVAVPLAMRRVRSVRDLRPWLVGALAVDALAFVGMGLASSLRVLFAFRLLDGAAHLPALTMLMVAANRASGTRRGGAMGVLATAIMLGVAVGSPVGGWLVERGVGWVYGTGALLLVVAATVTLRIPPATGAHAERGGSTRYSWNRRNPATWLPLAYGFMNRFSIGIFVSTFTLYLGQVLQLTAPERGTLVALFMLPFALLCYPVGRLADRTGWFAPMVAGNILFGIVFGSYGVVPAGWLPALMVASGVSSALMFAPNLLLISDLVRRGEGEGLFGAFQVAGSLGFLAGPIVGGVLVAVTQDASGQPAYAAIFTAVGGMEAVLVAIAFAPLRALARSTRVPALAEERVAAGGVG